MRTSDFDYQLPEELIAQTPAPNRPDSRLLVLHKSSGELEDRNFINIGDYLKTGDCLVLNDTKVIQARFYCKRQTGGKIEGLFLEQKNAECLVMLKNAGKVKTGEVLTLLDRQGGSFGHISIVERLSQDTWLIKHLGTGEWLSILDAVGFTPLPPYIIRNKITDYRLQIDDCRLQAQDIERYQTVYAACSGAVAAPTAGLHFTEEILQDLQNRGIAVAKITLHVGAGTFKPVKTEEMEKHIMHSERYAVGQAAAQTINQAKRSGGRIVPVGTTTLRTLETLCKDGFVKADTGSTNLYILPGYKFCMVDALITNFHLPKSTLLALVSAFAGPENIKRAYKHAVEKKYRFYSYGDAMLIIE